MSMGMDRETQALAEHLVEQADNQAFAKAFRDGWREALSGDRYRYDVAAEMVRDFEDVTALGDSDLAILERFRGWCEDHVDGEPIPESAPADPKPGRCTGIIRRMVGGTIHIEAQTEHPRKFWCGQKVEVTGV